MPNAMRFNTELNVNLSILEKNVSDLREILNGNEIIYMVKSNGYGHGAVGITKFAYEELGIKEFGLATLGEALQLRNEIPDGHFETTVFSELQFEKEDCRELYLNQRILPVLSSLSDLKIFLEDSSFKNCPILLHFNTGMNRLGFEMSEIEDCLNLIKKAGRKSISHLMTHFACASNSMKSNSHNKRQLENWNKLKTEFKGSGLDIEKTSISNSGAIEQGVGFEETHVRPGLMLYGPSSLIPPLREKSLWKGNNVSTLKAEVLKVFKVDRGQPIGYGATPCPDAGTVAIITLGYGDGFSTYYQGANIGDARIHGRVNMDMTQLYFTNDPNLKKGDTFNIWDNSFNSVVNFSDQVKSIPYEMFCALTARIPRTYSFEK